MKPIAVLALIAALVAFVVVQFSFVTSISMLFGVGLLALTVADYQRAHRPLALRATAMSAAFTRRERLGLAA
jgi:uncharacterized membrane protein YeiB